MANTSVVYARIDTNLKENAEEILLRLGISPSSAIQMLYSQIVLNRGIPFEVKLPTARPTAIGGMTFAELNSELAMGIESLKAGSYTVEEVDRMMAEEFGL